MSHNTGLVVMNPLAFSCLGSSSYVLFLFFNVRTIYFTNSYFSDSLVLCVMSELFDTLLSLYLLTWDILKTCFLCKVNGLHKIRCDKVISHIFMRVSIMRNARSNGRVIGSSDTNTLYWKLMLRVFHLETTRTKVKLLL